MSLAVFDKVSLWFGEREIVDDLDLRVAEQDRIGLIGPNGSGKSTHIDAVAGALRARGVDTLVTREPGGTPLGESLREALDPKFRR